MNWTTVFISFSIFLITAQRVASFCEFTNYASPVSNYSRLTNTTPTSYLIWERRCQELGTGWDMARIGDRDEFNVIDQLHRSAFTQESYYIGGMSDVNPAFNLIEIRQFGWPDNGLYHVFASYDLRLNRYFYSSPENRLLMGGLCEKGRNQTTGLTFASGFSYYQKLVSDSPHSYSYWRIQCRGLGSGWNPARIESQWEFEFLRVNQRYFSDFRSYWIDGYTSSAHLALINKCSVNNRGPVPGGNRVIVSTFDHQDYLNGGPGYQRAVFQLKALRSSHPVHGILCEKEKVMN